MNRLKNNNSITVVLFSTCIFLGSFLLFLIQPLIAKYLLPWFGGTSGVWTTSQVFFQVLLLLGYTYTLILTKKGIKAQFYAHTLLVLVITGIIFIYYIYSRTPLLPTRDEQYLFGEWPILQLLWILLTSIGLPYFLLSTTSTLLQKWFHRSYPSRSPYVLYAVSNTGSLLGIICYPFLFEPFFSIQQQAYIWAFLFFIYACVLCLCAYFVLQKKSPKQNKASRIKPPQTTQLKIYDYTYWIGLSALTSLLLLSVTNLLTQSIAPVPFLWLLPLCLYIASFIFAFSDSPLSQNSLYGYLLFLTVPLVLISTQTVFPSLLFLIVLYSIMSFSAFMLCHYELYRKRPIPEKLDVFYVSTAIGGALGGTVIGIIAPLFIPDLLEFYVGIYLLLGITFSVLLQNKSSLFSLAMNKLFSTKKEAYLFFCISLFVLTIFFNFIKSTLASPTVLFGKRGFYGSITVTENKKANDIIRVVYSGKIAHGYQYMVGKKRFEPTLYYAPITGIGKFLQDRTKITMGKDRPIRGAFIGLGTGTLAAYGKKNDYYRFYEINKDMVNIAEQYFTYIHDSEALIDVVVDDGRLALEEEVKRNEMKYDIIVMDAFSDDAIPVHLLTQEAIQIYLQRLEEKGILAFHITNTYLDLGPLLKNMAIYNSLTFEKINSASGLGEKTEWVVMRRKGKPLHNIEKGSPFWTDNYNNLLDVMK